MKKINSKAFSLVELSFSIVIIGVMIAGVVGGSVLIQKAKIATAQSLTKSSPVASTPDLKVWAETSLDNALTLTSGDTVVSQWNNINPQTKIKQSLTPAGTTNYSEQGINGLPSLDFLSDSHLVIPVSNILNNSSYTIFLVEKPRPPSSSGDTISVSLIGGAVFDSYDNDATPIQLYYDYETTNKTYHRILYGGSGIYTTTFAYGKPNIHTLKYNRSLNTSYYWRNGGVNPESSTSGGNLSNCYTNWLGYHGTSTLHYRGQMSEFIVFNRSLTNEERQDIEAYLGKKYAIPIS